MHGEGNMKIGQVISIHTLKESPIPTLREKYKMISSRRSFSFTEKRNAARYRLKISISVLAIAVLAWYGKQAVNNPFCRTCLVISGNTEGCSITRFRHSFINDTAFVFLPLDNAGSRSLCFDLPQTWYLVSPTETVGTGTFASPPLAWMVLFPQEPPTERFQGWPLPVPSIAWNGFSVVRNHPFSDQRTSHLLHCDSSAILVLDAKGPHPDRNDLSSSLKEKLEILIVLNATQEAILSLRDIFRPRYLIAQGGLTENRSFPQNVLLCTGQKSACHSFRIARDGTVALEGD